MSHSDQVMDVMGVSRSASFHSGGLVAADELQCAEHEDGPDDDAGYADPAWGGGGLVEGDADKPASLRASVFLTVTPLLCSP